MKKIRFFCFGLAALLVAGMVIFSSCKKEEDDNQYSYRAAQDNSRAEGAFNRCYSEIQKAARQVGNKSTNDTINGCPTLYITGTWPKTLTLDYGSTGCACNDGVTRKGQIITVITGLYVDSNSVATSTFNNFSETINGVEHNITGTQTITNLGHNAQGHPHFSVDVQNASVSYTEGTIHWTSQRENEWILGYDTYLNPFDDEYSVTGSANGTDINGASFSVNITSPLICKYCMSMWRWIVTSGALDIINPGYPNITVDYGNGDCDLIVYVIINGTSYTIVLT
ncbi:MAG TPA: hypothetical protein PKW80_06155 [Bacteroidales bacterium]|nr:hypothetical protein [Bacteroidales bacterium]